ncbi:MAG: CotH kinase family protein, partial [Saprospiraceae bacterium]
MRTKSIILLNALLLLLSSCGRDDEMGEFHDSPDPLPVLQINLNHSTDTISRGVYVEGLLQIPSTDISNNFDASLEIRGRGNSTWTFPKKPYQIRLEEKASILGMPDDRRWILLANYSDKSMLRNELAFDLSRMSHLHWTPDSRFIELELDNDFVGTYQLTQKVEVTDERIGIGKDGYLLEVDQLNRLAPDDVYFESENYLFNIKEPALQVGDEKYEYILSYIQEAEAALLGPNFKDAQEGYQKYFDVDA